MKQKRVGFPDVLETAGGRGDLTRLGWTRRIESTSGRGGSQLLNIFHIQLRIFQLDYFSSKGRTAKTQYWKFETNIPRKGIARPQSQFPHLCVCERFIYSQDIARLFSCRKICGPILGIYKSLTDTWMWKLGLGLRNSFSVNTEMGFSLQCVGIR